MKVSHYKYFDYYLADFLKARFHSRLATSSLLSGLRPSLSLARARLLSQSTCGESNYLVANNFIKTIMECRYLLFSAVRRLAENYCFHGSLTSELPW